MFTWLWRGVISNAVYAVLSVVIIAGVGIVVGWLRMIENSFATPALYFLGAASLTAITLFAIRMLINVPIPQTQITTDNIEQNVRTWCDTFKLGTQKESDPDAIWAIIITLKDGRSIVVFRPKSQDRYMVLQSKITLSAEHAAKYKALSQGELDHFRSALVIEIARSGAAFEWRQNDINLMIRIPITSTLTEAEFIKHIEEISNATLVAIAAVNLQLESKNNSPIQPAVKPIAR